jgi:glycosyltransferase 2 family protein
MKKSELFFKILLYLSIPFILFYLYRLDYIHLKHIHFNYWWMGASLIFLWAGFIFSTVSWRYALYFHHIKISLKSAIVSHGLPVFAKYIPGKVWVILGRASYITKDGYKIQDTSFVSLKEQLLFIMLGLLISFIPALWYFQTSYISALVILTIIGLLLILINPWVHAFAEKILEKIFKKGFSLPRLTMALTFKLSFYIIIYWAFWIFGFYCLICSFCNNVAILMAFAFPFSVCYGLLALFTPGGIGVREGLMVAFLVISGLDTQTAVTFSIIARLWFMTGEVFIFLLAIILRTKLK